MKGKSPMSKSWANHSFLIPCYSSNCALVEGSSQWVFRPAWTPGIPSWSAMTGPVWLVTSMLLSRGPTTGQLTSSKVRERKIHSRVQIRRGTPLCVPCTVPKIWFMYSQKWNCTALFPCPTFMYLSAIFLFPGLICLIGCSKIGILGIFKALTDTWMWKLGDRTL